MNKQPSNNLPRRFLTGGCSDGGGGDAWTGGITGGCAVMVGARSWLPQLRQKPSPGAAGVPHLVHVSAFIVGSLIRHSQANVVGFCFTSAVFQREIAQAASFYRERQSKSIAILGHGAAALPAVS